MLRQIHPKTFEHISSESETLVNEYAGILGDDPTYFAPFLRGKVIRGELPQEVCELASLEWALHSLPSFDGHNASSVETVRINPTFQVLRLHYNADDLLRSAFPLPEQPTLLAIYRHPKTNQKEQLVLTPSMARVLDALEDGMAPDAQWREAVEELFNRGVLLK